MSSPEPSSSDQTVWLKPSEAVTLTRLSDRTLARMANAGKIDAYTTPGGHRRYSRESIEKLLAPNGTAA